MSTRLPSSTELYEQTSGRWLYNEVQQNEVRHTRYNVNELIRVACGAMNAHSCLSMQKIAEGSFNKIFRMTFDNEKTLIARMPSSLMFGSGVSWVVASEVATLVMASKVKVHVPRVVAWNKHLDVAQNPVGAPYILMEDVPGVSLEREWHTPDMRGDPVADLLDKMLNNVNRQTLPAFSQIGSIYLSDDFPSDRHLFAPIHVGAFQPEADHLRVGPMADLLWWRSFHDEHHLDRGPWDTLEQCIRAAVRLERRAVERHRADPSSLSFTRSTLSDLDVVEHLLDKVDALAPHLQPAIERASPYAERFMQNIFLHPDLRAQNIMVAALTPDNARERMMDPVIVDWQGTVILPFALQHYTPHFVEYEPKLFRADGTPVIQHNGLIDSPWPSEFDQLTPDQQEVIRAEHRLSTRHVRWNEVWLQNSLYGQVLAFGLQDDLHVLLQTILRACADGPQALRYVLSSIKETWEENPDKYGPCPLTFSSDEETQLPRVKERFKRFEEASTRLSYRLNSSNDGWVRHEDYEASMRELEVAKREWDEEACGGPFPFEDGRWGQFLR